MECGAYISRPFSATSPAHVSMSPTFRPTAILAACLASSVLVAQGPPRPQAATTADAAVQERITRERREDLARHPANGWALYALAESLRRQGRGADAARAQARFSAAWAQADLPAPDVRY